MPRTFLRWAAAGILGLLTTVALAWGLAAFAGSGSRPSCQSVFMRTDYYVPFGRQDAWGRTQLYWRALAETGGSRWGTVDRLCTLPAWSRARSLPGPYSPAIEFPKLAQTFEVASGWPMRAMRAEFRDYPQGTPWAGGNPYITVRGIPLPSRVNRTPKSRSYAPAALPYEPIWPGFLGNTAFYSAYWLALLVGVPAARRILRAKRGCCLGCGYDAAGLAPGAVCPECGGVRRDGRRLGRWWPAVPLIAVVLLCAAAAAIGSSVAAARGLSVDRIMPLSLLRSQARSEEPAAAIDEIRRRMDQGRLSPKAVGGLIDDALALQADTLKLWEPRWGDLVESARAAGLVSDERWRTYARQAVVFTLKARSPVRVGDHTPLRIAQDARVGTGRMFGVEASAAPMALGGIKGTITYDPRFNVPLSSPPSIARYGNGDLRWYGPGGGGASWVLQPQEVGAANANILTWPAAERAGHALASIELNVKIVENSYAGATGLMPRPTSTAMLVEYPLTLTAPVEVVPAGTETVSLITGPSELEAQLREALQPVTPAMNDRFSPVPMLEREGQAVYAKGSFKIRNLPVPVAFEVFWRAGGREWRMGRLVVNRGGTGEFRPQQRAPVEGFDAATVDIILRPSPDAARGDPDMTEIWGGELAFPNIEVRPPASPLPGAG